jgi:hypothetical protein
MRIALSLLVLLSSNVSFASWGGLEGSITRTSATPSVFRVQEKVDLYHSVCTSEEVFGPSAQCGTSQDCSFNNQNEYVCSEVTNSCTHTETTCNNEYSHTVVVTFDLNFDSRAPLASGQTEKVELDIDVDGNEVELETEVQSKFYKYQETKVKFQLNQVGQTSIVMKKKKN